jgi:hypothetical protein
LLAAGPATLLATAASPQAARMTVTARSRVSSHVFVRIVFKTTPYSCGVQVRSLGSRVTGVKSFSEPEYLKSE